MAKKTINIRMCQIDGTIDSIGTKVPLLGELVWLRDLKEVRIGDGSSTVNDCEIISTRTADIQAERDAAIAAKTASEAASTNASASATSASNSASSASNSASVATDGANITTEKLNIVLDKTNIVIESEENARIASVTATEQATIAVTNATESLEQAGIATERAQVAIERASLASASATSAFTSATDAANSAETAIIADDILTNLTSQNASATSNIADLSTQNALASQNLDVYTESKVLQLINAQYNHYNVQESEEQEEILCASNLSVTSGTASTIAIPNDKMRNTTNYKVKIETISATVAVGFVASDKQLNGFKITPIGGDATINATISGGVWS